MMVHRVFSIREPTLKRDYSETSDSGPSEKRTLYYKPLYRGQFMGPENSVSLL